MNEQQSKQEQSLMIEKATEVFLQNGGKIEKLPTMKAVGAFDLDIFKERVDSVSHNLSLFEENSALKSISTLNNKIATRLKTIYPERKHPWRNRLK